MSEYKVNKPVPTYYSCVCGCFVFSPTNEPILKKLDKAIGKYIEHKCTCGSSMTPGLPLVVVELKNPDMKIKCTPCNVIYRRVSQTRIICPSCDEVGFAQGLEIWFKPTARVNTVLA